MRKTGSSKCIICFCKNSFFVSNISLDLQNRYKHVRVLHFQWLIDSFRLHFRHFRSYQTPNLKKIFLEKFYKIQSEFCYENSDFIYGFSKKLDAPNRTHFLPFKMLRALRTAAVSTDLLYLCHFWVKYPFFVIYGGNVDLLSGYFSKIKWLWVRN